MAGFELLIIRHRLKKRATSPASILFPNGYNLAIAGPGTTAHFPSRDLLIEPAPAPLTKYMDIIRIILAIFLPPVAVFLNRTVRRWDGQLFYTGECVHGAGPRRSRRHPE